MTSEKATPGCTIINYSRRSVVSELAASLTIHGRLLLPSLYGYGSIGYYEDYMTSVDEMLPPLTVSQKVECHSCH